MECETGSTKRFLNVQIDIELENSLVVSYHGTDNCNYYGILLKESPSYPNLNDAMLKVWMSDEHKWLSSDVNRLNLPPFITSLADMSALVQRSTNCIIERGHPQLNSLDETEESDMSSSSASGGGISCSSGSSPVTIVKLPSDIFDRTRYRPLRAAAKISSKYKSAEHCSTCKCNEKIVVKSTGKEKNQHQLSVSKKRYLKNHLGLVPFIQLPTDDISNIVSRDELCCSALVEEDASLCSVGGATDDDDKSAVVANNSNQSLLTVDILNNFVENEDSRICLLTKADVSAKENVQQKTTEKIYTDIQHCNSVDSELKLFLAQSEVNAAPLPEVSKEIEHRSMHGQTMRLKFKLHSIGKSDSYLSAVSVPKQHYGKKLEDQTLSKPNVVNNVFKISKKRVKKKLKRERDDQSSNEIHSKVNGLKHPKKKKKHKKHLPKLKQLQTSNLALNKELLKHGDRFLENRLCVGLESESVENSESMDGIAELKNKPLKQLRVDNIKKTAKKPTISSQFVRGKSKLKNDHKKSAAKGLQISRCSKKNGDKIAEYFSKTEYSELRQGSIVWAKMEPFPWWPAVIFNSFTESKETNTMTFCALFFGDNSHIWVSGNHLEPFMRCFKKNYNKPRTKKYNKNFHRSVAEALAEYHEKFVQFDANNEFWRQCCSALVEPTLKKIADKSLANLLRQYSASSDLSSSAAASCSTDSSSSFAKSTRRKIQRRATNSKTNSSVVVAKRLKLHPSSQQQPIDADDEELVVVDSSIDQIASLCSSNSSNVIITHHDITLKSSPSESLDSCDNNTHDDDIDDLNSSNSSDNKLSTIIEGGDEHAFDIVKAFVDDVLLQTVQNSSAADFA